MKPSVFITLFVDVVLDLIKQAIVLHFTFYTVYKRLSCFSQPYKNLET